VSLRRMLTAQSRGLLLLAVSSAAACAIEPNSVMSPRLGGAGSPVSVAGEEEEGQPAARPDLLGAKPALGAPKAFEPPTPQVFKAPNGMTVWLVERHTLPLVSATVTIPLGASSDPKEKAGLAYITADMLDEGAGKRNAVEVSTAINDLGASLATGARLDGSFATLSVLKKNFKPAFEILSDVVARPRFEFHEWKRVADLWRNDLQKRSQDPNAVSRVVTAAVLYGPGTPYGHPVDGLLADAKRIDLPAVKGFYEANWRADLATLVIAGDITKDEVMEATGAAFGAWKAPNPTGKVPAPPSAEVRSGAPRLVLVDRADAPQSVIAVVREGVSASDAKAPVLDLINTALGGSFTSRLNQNLREDHGWTYGASSRFSETRATGLFTARAAVVTEATGPALKEMLRELEKMAASGLTSEEVGKVQAQDRADLMQTYETVGAVSQRLSSLAQLGLPPGFDAAATRARQQATKAQLAGLAGAVGPGKATIIVVGSKGAVPQQLAAIGLPEPEFWDAEGFPLKGADVGAAKPPPGGAKPAEGAAKPPAKPAEGAAKPPAKPAERAAELPAKPAEGAAKPPAKPAEGAAKPPAASTPPKK
jgi:zinc protease